MLTYLSGFIRSFIYYLIVARQLKRQRKFMALELKPLLDNAQNRNDGSMDTDDFKKINLYGLAIPAVLGEAFCSLRGKPMTEKERMSVTCLGGITGLFDDLFDRKNLSPDYIYQLLQHPSEKNAANINEKLLVKLYTLGLENSDKPELIKTYAAKVYEAQLMSLRQNAPGLTRDEITQITFEKGGVSMPLYRCGFGGEIPEREYNLIYNLGAIGQLENDIFDVYKDHHSGVQTLATTETDISQLRTIYEKQLNKIFGILEETSFRPRNKKKFRLFVILVVGSGFVCIDQLMRTSKHTQGEFKPGSYNRKDLICDMQHPFNILKLLHYAAIYAKK